MAEGSGQRASIEIYGQNEELEIDEQIHSSLKVVTLSH